MRKDFWLKVFLFAQNELPIILAFVAIFFYLMTLCSPLYANIPRLPGADEMDKLTAAGSLLRLVDTILFKFGTRLMAGLCILSAGWNLKEQRFGIAMICVLAAVVIGTAPMWVKNIFDIGGGTLFSFINSYGAHV